jgi:hypothetical protein
VAWTSYWPIICISTRFLSMSLAFEANTFDGKDAEFAGEGGSGSGYAATPAMLTVITVVTRRYTTWWIRNTGQRLLPFAASAQKEVIIEPTSTPITVWM